MSNKKMPKVIASVLSVALVGFFSNPVQAAPKNKKPVTITYWTHVEETNQMFEKTLISEFEKKNPGIKVNMVPVPEGELITKLATSIAAGSGPDLVNIIRRAMPQLATKGLLAPMDFSQVKHVYGDKFASDAAAKKKFYGMYDKYATDLYQWGGKLVGIPHEINAYTTFGNMTFLKRAGINKLPTNWDEVIAACAAINKANLGVSPLVLPLNSAGQQYLVFDQLVRAHGGAAVGAPINVAGTKPNLESIPVIQALTLWRDLIKKHNCIDPALGPAAGFTAESVFTSKKSAMFMSASGWYVKAMKNFHPDLYANYAVGPLPTLKAGDKPVGGTVYSYGLLVPKTSKLSGEAWRFALYMSSQGQRGFDATGVWYGDKATKLSKKTAASENWSVFRQTIDTGSPLPTVVPYIQYITAVKSMIDQVILGGVEPAQAAKDAQLAVVRLLYS